MQIYNTENMQQQQFISLKQMDIFEFTIKAEININFIHLMNFTQPSLKKKLENKTRDYDSQKPILPVPFMIVPEEIHKTPQAIRKAIKMGKYKKQYRHSASQNKQQRQLNQLNEASKELMIQINARQIFAKNDSIDTKNNKKIHQGYDDISQALKNEVNRIREKGQRMLYVRKKLSPLKKGATVQSKIRTTSDKKHMKITFFNVEKLNLVKMYSDLSSEKSSPDKKVDSQYTFQKDRYNFNTTTYQADPNDFVSSTAVEFFHRSQAYTDGIMSPTKHRQLKIKNAFRPKPFEPPYQRYHYRDFLWKVSLSHGLYFECPQQYQQKFKIYIGRGNNSMLVKSLFKRRSAWWNFTERYDEANLIWTQIKIYDIFKWQTKKEKQYLKKQPKGEEKTGRMSELKKLGTSYQQHSKLLRDSQIQAWNQYFNKHRKLEDKIDETMVKRNKNFKLCSQLEQISLKNIKIHNHLSGNYVIGNKKALYYTMSKYYQLSGEDVFDHLPLTFHIQKGLQDPEYLKFLNVFYAKAKNIRQDNKLKEQSPQKFDKKKVQRNVWIVKPGQFTNRGNGITVCFSLDQIKKILKKQQRHDNGNPKTYIVQSYLERPFLYYRRKFDIRHYMMVSSINGRLKGYWYQLGYVRTTSFQYTLKQNYTSIHLTNDAVQKYLPQYGKYEKGNKLSYQDLQKYLDKQFSGQYDFMKTVYPKMKKIATDAVKASALTIDPDRKNHNFEIFGMDFMIDNQFKPWLIEINTNPCLQLSCPLLAEIIPQMVENAFKICVDAVIPPPANFQQKRPKFNDKSIQKNKFELVYDSAFDEESIKNMLEGVSPSLLKQLNIQEDDEVFEDDGIELED